METGNECKEIQSMILDHLDGELSPDMDARVKQHVDGCPECARAYEKSMSLIGLMRSAEVVYPEPAFWESLPERILAEGRIEKAPERETTWTAGWTAGWKSALAWFRSRFVWVIVPSAVAASILVPG